MFVVVSSHLN